MNDCNNQNTNHILEKHNYFHGLLARKPEVTGEKVKRFICYSIQTKVKRFDVIYTHHCERPAYFV